MNADSGDSSEDERRSNSGDSSEDEIRSDLSEDEIRSNSNDSSEDEIRSDLSEDEIRSNSNESSEDESSSNSPDGHLRLWKDPMIWIRKNPTLLLSVRRLELDYSERSGKGIIVDSIGELTELTHLSIEDFETITCLPNNLTTLFNLQMVELYGCRKLQELPPNLGDLESLTSLSVVSCTSIKILPDSLAKLSKLTNLKISFCKGLEELPANFGELESLMQFTLTCCSCVKSLPDSFAKLSKLTKLNISGCFNLEELPANFGELGSLMQFTLTGCSRVKSLPDSFAKLSELAQLNISCCGNLEELPANFGELESLTHFTLRSIKSLPSSVAKLSKLTTLQIEFCQNLQDLPANLGELNSITHLCIENCRSLNKCRSNLTAVDLSLICCCSIQSLPRGLSNLTQLHLPLCITLKERLASLKYFVSLRHLKFQECSWCRSYVKELPENLGNPPQLSVLDIKDTRIKCLPSSITKLSKLRLLLLPSQFMLEMLPYQLDESLVISVEDTHVRKTWKEFKKEMEIFSFATVRDDPTPWIQSNYTSQILDVELGHPDAVNIKDSITELRELTHLYITGSLTRSSYITGSFTGSSYNRKFVYDLESTLDSLRKLSTLESLHISLYDTEILDQMDLPVSLRQLTLTLCLWEDIQFARLLLTKSPLHNSMTKLSNLKALHLFGKGMPFNSLPENLNLERLKLVDCYINTLPRGLRHVEILHGKERKCIHDCDKLGNCFNQLVDVETLSVTCHHIEFLPSIAGLHNLQELQLKDCFCIKELPPGLDEVVNLCTLNVSGTRIKSFSSSISMLPKLQDLILPKCFQRGSLPKFRNQSIMVSIDDTDDKYYKDKDKGYYNFVHETCSEVDNNTTNSIERVNEVVSKESEEGIISQQQISPHQLLNQPDVTSVLKDSHGSEANHPLGENSHHTFLQSEQLIADSRLLNLQNPCFPSSQHALQHEHLALMTSEIENGFPPNFQHDFSRVTENNLLNSGNGQNEDNTHREGYNFHSKDHNPVSHHSIHHLPNQEMPKNIRVNEEVSKESEEAIIAEQQQTSPQQSLNLPAGALSDSNYNGSHSQDMDILCRGTLGKMITESSSSFQENSRIGRNSQHAVQNGHMDITNSDTGHDENTFLNPGNSSCNQRDVSLIENNLDTLENRQIEINSESEGKKGKRKRNEITREEIQSQFGKKQKDAARHFGVQLSTMKRRCRELGIKEWPSSRMWRRTNKRKASRKSPSKSGYSQHVVEYLDGVNQHVLSNPVPDHVPFGSNVVDNSTLVATQRRRDSDQRVQQHLDGTNLGTSSTTVQPNECSRTIVVKATYKDDQVKVHFSLSSDVELLKEKIGKKLKLEVDKFKMKYQDEDKDLLLVAGISDLEDALRVSESSGSNVVRLCIEDDVIFRDFDYVN